jgi:hypothetical protein
VVKVVEVKVRNRNQKKRVNAVKSCFDIRFAVSGFSVRLWSPSATEGTRLARTVFMAIKVPITLIFYDSYKNIACVKKADRN